MTTLIGCRCKSGNIFSRALLIGRGLFLKKLFKMINILCNFQRTSWKPRIIGRQQTKVCWWPSKRKPPVPIPNTVVKTLSGDNTWRATSWEDNSLPTSILTKKRIDWIISSLFLWSCFVSDIMLEVYYLFTFLLSLLRQSHPVLGFCSTLRSHSLYFAGAK